MNMRNNLEEGIQEAACQQRILVVDDNPGDVETVTLRLSEGSPTFEIHRAGSVREALGVLAQGTMDAVILDLGLPDSSGIDTVNRVRASSRATSIIVVTGAIDDRLRDLAFAAGADEIYLKDETNNRLFWRSVLHIIERKRERLTQMRRLLDAMPDAVLVVNLDGVVRYVNQAAIELFGRSRSELLGERLGFSVRDGEPAEIMLPRPDGERTCEIRVVSLFWNDEATHLATVRDITERRHAEQLRLRTEALEAENQRIVAASRTKSAFLANMSHELRTPLNAIIGFSQIILAGKVDPQSPQFSRFTSHILTSGRHLLELINDILDLAKVEAGKVEFRPVPVDLVALVEEVTEVLSEIARQKGIRVAKRYDTAVRNVCIDPSRFKQVLYNYLSNALKFTPDAGSVTVSVGPEGDDRFRVDVADTGIGIAADDLPKLFTEFQQLEGGASKRHQGTGLGLALTRRLVEAQGGEVAVRSEPGRGSVFSAILPRQAAPAEVHA